MQQEETDSVEVGPHAKRRATIFLFVAGAILWFPLVQLLLGNPRVFFETEVS